jgi:hypothetical protein
MAPFPSWRDRDVENQRAEATWWNAAPDLPRGHGGLRVYRVRNKLSRGVYKVCITVGIRLEFVEMHVLYSKLHIYPITIQQTEPNSSLNPNLHVCNFTIYINHIYFI